MGWPKGVSRKGYISKDGTPHRRRGEVLEMITMAVSADKPTKKRGRKPKYPDGWLKPEWKSLLRWPSGPWIESCPQCDFPEADGGYCVACGWSKPVREGRVT